MTTIAERLKRVTASIEQACLACDRDPATVQLLPVSKRQPAAAVVDAMEHGLVEFGENRVQELCAKSAELRSVPVRWHMIGSLQTNKIDQLLGVEGLETLHSLDRVRLADGLQASLASKSKSLRILLQIDATGEEAKHGASPDEVQSLLDHVVRNCPALSPVGVMAMGPLRGDSANVFANVARLHDDLRQASGLALPTRSLGMTHDMAAAIAAGSTMVRVGTGVFGPRA